MIRISNGRNCRSYNKANVCKYQETVVEEVDSLIGVLDEKGKDLPLSININCQEYCEKPQVNMYVK